MRFFIFLGLCMVVASFMYADVTIKTSKDSYDSFQNIEVVFSGMVGESGEWANIILATENVSKYGDWKYTSKSEGNLVFAGKSPGQYEARIFDKNNKLLGKYPFTVVSSNKPMFEVKPGMKYSKFTQVFKGGDQSVLKLTILRVGTKEEKNYLIKFSGTIDHDWNGKIVPYRLEERWAHGTVDRAYYWTIFNSKRHNTIEARKNRWGKGLNYTVCLPGTNKGISIYFSEKLSQKSKSKDIFDEYLKSVAGNIAVAQKTANRETLSKKVDELESTIQQLRKENLQIAQLQGRIGQLEKQLADAKSTHEKYRAKVKEEMASLKRHNNKLAKKLETTMKKTTPNKAPVKKVNMSFADHLRFRTDSYYRNGVRFQWYSVELMVNNHEEKPDSIIDAEMKMWVDEKWKPGTMLKDKFPLPQKLEAMSPTNVYATAEIQSDNYLFPITVSIKFKLFSGAILEKEAELKK